MDEDRSQVWEVVIVGAGPSGLALAVELGMRGIRCLVVERNDRIGISPRAKTTNVRTRTHLRRWGIADRLADASPFGVSYPSDVHFVTRLGGESLAVIENASNCATERDDRYPEHGQWVPQYRLEQVLRDRVASLPTVELRLGVAFQGCVQGAEAVVAAVEDAGGKTLPDIRARFLVGADGARSRVRENIGVSMRGDAALSRNYNIVFRAPGLAQAHRQGPGCMYWQVHPDAPSLVGPLDKDDLWFFMPTRLPKGFEVTCESAAQLIHHAIGLHIELEVLRSDEWIASSLLADGYRRGGVFLIGDACHVHPPFGGYGMNMGVADGVDLGWKLAAVLRNWGGAALLDTYEQERRPVHAAVIEEARLNHAVLSNDLWRDDLESVGEAGDAARRSAGERIVALKEREFHTLGTVLGGCYEGSPIIGYDGSAAPAADSMCYQPSSRPGCLAPHAWRGERSLYDLFGVGFTLLFDPSAAALDVDLAKAQAERLGIPLVDVALASAELPLYPAALTLVRPDQIVAWRGQHWHDGLLAQVTGNGAALDIHDRSVRPG